jgi:hypothetical protein
MPQADLSRSGSAGSFANSILRYPVSLSCTKKRTQKYLRPIRFVATFNLPPSFDDY